MPVQVCSDPAANMWPHSGEVAELVELIGSEGLDTSATVGSLTLAGSTLTGSLDGEWIGERVVKEVTARDGEGTKVCFDVDMEPYSATVLVIKHTVSVASTPQTFTLDTATVAE